MNRCDTCDNVYGGSQIKRTSTIRNVVYNRFFKRRDYNSREATNVFVDSYNGQEIAEQEIICPECFDKVKDIEPSIEEKVKKVDFIGQKPYKKETDDGKKPLKSFEGLGDRYGTAKDSRRNGEGKRSRRDSNGRDHRTKEFGSGSD